MIEISCTIYGNVLYNVLYIEIISVPFFIIYFVYSVQYMYGQWQIQVVAMVSAETLSENSVRVPNRFTVRVNDKITMSYTSVLYWDIFYWSKFILSPL